MNLSMRDPHHVAAQTWSWALSLLVHGLAIAAAIALVSDLRLAPQPEPFRWVVSQITDTPQQRPSPPTTTSGPPSEPAPPPAQERMLTAPRDLPVPLQTTQAPAPDTKAMEASPPTMPASTGIPIAPSPVMADAQAPPASQASPVPAFTPAIDSAVSQDTAKESRHIAEAAEQSTSTEVPQTASLLPVPQASMESSSPAVPVKADYGWLAQTLRTRIEGLKRYPPQARSSRLEGRVVLRAVIGEAGELVDLTVLESSGHPVLDNAAVDVLKRACPLSLPHPLGRPRVVVQVPISYQLR